MVYKFYPITGIAAGKGPNGEVPLRQDIEVWSSKPENRTQVVLFLKALKRLQDVPPENRDSFFQIAGIASALYLISLTLGLIVPARNPWHAVHFMG